MNFLQDAHQIKKKKKKNPTQKTRMLRLSIYINVSTISCLNLLVLFLILYKCLHFFKIFEVFEHIYKQNLQALREVPEAVSFANKNVSGLQKYSRFQNEYNKVEIELRFVQFWTEIKLVITNRTRDFVITRLISVQIALHSVQLPLLII